MESRELTTTTPAPLTREQVDLIKRTVARGASDDELSLFLHVAQRTGLDPLVRQVYAVKRYNRVSNREEMTIQTGIDGLRLVAERTGRYAPGREPEYVYDDRGRLTAATSYVKKMTADGTWHEVAATAHFAEYAQTTRDGKPTRFWTNMPHVMLAKCAEALALRRAFPMELSGLYSHEEMTQADVDAPTPKIEQPTPLPAPRHASVPPPSEAHAPPDEPEPPDDAVAVITDAQRRKLFAAATRAGKSHADLADYLGREHGIESTKEIPRDLFDKILAWVQGEAT